MARLIADAGLLVAADRNDRVAWGAKRRAIDDELDLAVPAPVIVQVWRGPGSVNLGRFLTGLEVIVLDESVARIAGNLLGVSRTSDVTDAVVAACARDGDTIWTGDVADLTRLVELRGVRVNVERI